MNKNKFLITQSLLAAWHWIYKSDGGYEDFLKTLSRERVPPSVAMLDGIQFENMVAAYCGGAEIPEGHKWKCGIEGVGNKVRGGAFQVRLSREIIVSDMHFVLYGILDVLKCGKIMDIKFSKKYRYGKYGSSIQHPVYFALCPEAAVFEYIISNGSDIFTEKYYRNDAVSAEAEIKEFLNFLQRQGLFDIYLKKWKSKY